MTRTHARALARSGTGCAHARSHARTHTRMARRPPAVGKGARRKTTAEIVAGLELAQVLRLNVKHLQRWVTTGCMLAAMAAPASSCRRGKASEGSRNVLEIKRASVSAQKALTWTVPEDTRNISRAGSFSCSAAEPTVFPCTALLILLYCGAEER